MLRERRNAFADDVPRLLDTRRGRRAQEVEALRRFMPGCEDAKLRNFGMTLGIRDTRKTTPGLRALEKAAVRAGGGANHRGSLSDAVLVKDNHLRCCSVAEAVARARRCWPGVTVEVECDTLEQVAEARSAGADLVLLDNMAPAQVAEAARLLAGAVPVEVSGGVRLDSVSDYAAAGADFISVGALTHSAPVLDIALDLE